MLDNTNTSSLVDRNLIIVDEPTPIHIVSMSFDPRNEGEEATYTVTFVPTNPIMSTMEILLTFPSQYDKILGQSIGCKSPNGLLGTIYCDVVDRTVYIYGFETYLPDMDSPVVIQVFGVVNPNKDQV